MAGGGSAIRGSRVGAGPIGEAERGEAAPAPDRDLLLRPRAPLGRSRSRSRRMAPESWDCPKCGLPASMDADNPPPARKIEPYKTHLAYVKERRSDEEAAEHPRRGPQAAAQPPQVRRPDLLTPREPAGFLRPGRDSAGFLETAPGASTATDRPGGVLLRSPRESSSRPCGSGRRGAPCGSPRSVQPSRRAASRLSRSCSRCSGVECHSSPSYSKAMRSSGIGEVEARHVVVAVPHLELRHHGDPALEAPQAEDRLGRRLGAAVCQGTDRPEGADPSRAGVPLDAGQERGVVEARAAGAWRRAPARASSGHRTRPRSCAVRRRVVTARPLDLVTSCSAQVALTAGRDGVAQPTAAGRQDDGDGLQRQVLAGCQRSFSPVQPGRVPVGDHARPVEPRGAATRPEERRRSVTSAHTSTPLTGRRRQSVGDELGPAGGASSRPRWPRG